jgi:hypothetical protein
MSISRITDPRDYVPIGARPFIPTPVRHPIEVSVQATDSNATLSAFAYLSVSLSSVLDPLSFIAFNDVRFDFVQSPTAGQLPWLNSPVSSAIPPAPTPVLNVLYALYFAMQASAAITADYEVSFDEINSRIDLRAKKAGPRYSFTNLIAGPGFAFGSGAGSSPEAQDNVSRLRCRLRLFIDAEPQPRLDQFGPYGNQTVPRWQEVGSGIERPFVSNQITFRIDDMLRPYVRPTAPRFSLFVSEWERFDYVPNSAIRWHYEASFNYVDENGFTISRPGFVGGRDDATTNFWAANWGLNPWLTEAEAQEASLTVWGMVQEQPPNPGAHLVRFMTNQPAVKRMDWRSLEWLQLHKGLPDGWLFLRAVWMYEDGQTETEFIPSFSRQSDGAGIVRLEVSPRCLPSPETKAAPVTGQPVETYSLQVYWGATSDPNAAVPVTDAQTYSPQREDQCDDTFYQIMFMNRLGGFDTLWLGSRVELEADVQRQTYPNYRRFTSDRENVDYQTRIERSRIKGKASAGYITQDEAIWLTDLQGSDEVYLMSYDTALGGFAFRLIEVSDIALSVDEFRATGPQSTAVISFTYLIDLQ